MASSPTPREGAARPEELAREVLRLEADTRGIRSAVTRWERGQKADAFSANHCSTIAQAYLDLLAERERTRATLEALPAPVGFDADNVLDIADSWEKAGIAQHALNRLSGSHERKGS